MLVLLCSPSAGRVHGRLVGRARGLATDGLVIDRLEAEPEVECRKEATKSEDQSRQAADMEATTQKEEEEDEHMPPLQDTSASEDEESTEAKLRASASTATRCTSGKRALTLKQVYEKDSDIEDERPKPGKKSKLEESKSEQAAALGEGARAVGARPDAVAELAKAPL